jgi:hypothetical protein
MSLRRLALLVGNGTYDPVRSHLQSLRCPLNDITGMEQILSDPERGAFDKVVTLGDRPAHEVQRAMQQILSEATSEDLVIVYYSGHGKQNREGNLFLAMADTDSKLLESTSVGVATIREFIKLSNCHRVVLILDCCYSGAAGAAFLKGDVSGPLKTFVQARGTYILTGSTQTQAAVEKEKDEYSLFTKHLIYGIRTGDADINGDGKIGVQELYQYTHDAVMQESPQEPTQFGIDVRGDLDLINSGRVPRKERADKVKKLVIDLNQADRLADETMLEILRVVVKPADSLSSFERRLDALISKLLEGKFSTASFLVAWGEAHGRSTDSSTSDPGLKPEVGPRRRPSPPSPQNLQPTAVAAASFPQGENRTPKSSPLSGRPDGLERESRDLSATGNDPFLKTYSPTSNEVVSSRGAPAMGSIEIQRMNRALGISTPAFEKEKDKVSEAGSRSGTQKGLRLGLVFAGVLQIIAILLLIGAATSDHSWSHPVLESTILWIASACGFMQFLSVLFAFPSLYRWSSFFYFASLSFVAGWILSLVTIYRGQSTLFQSLIIVSLIFVPNFIIYYCYKRRLGAEGFTIKPFKGALFLDRMGLTNATGLTIAAAVNCLAVILILLHDMHNADLYASSGDDSLGVLPRCTEDWAFILALVFAVGALRGNSVVRAFALLGFAVCTSSVFAVELRLDDRLSGDEWIGRVQLYACLPLLLAVGTLSFLRGSYSKMASGPAPVA